MDEPKKYRTAKRLTGSLLAVILLAGCLCITTYALTYSAVTVENNVFQTGIIKLNLNDGKPVIEEHEFLFEPGMTVEKEFFLENQSTWDVYYRLYFSGIEGDLANVLEVKIRDGEKILFSGRMAELTRDKVGATDDLLKMNERRDLTISFHFPEEAGNASQSLDLVFTIGADAVQTKNNPEKQFE